MATKKYVGVNDIVAVRVECRKCNTALEVNLDSYDSGKNQFLFDTCPERCEVNWKDDVLPHLQQRVQTGLKDFVQELKTIKKDPRYSLTFEVKQDKAET